ncbi:MAG: PAS domain-containing protein [Gammaproteobacteria bacterium]|nr:PAS domain-containing protein [Gammaproteobacteria bacterium]
MLYGTLLISSILLQTVAVIQSIYLLRITAWRSPWLLLVLAITLMLIRQLSEFYLYLSGHQFHSPQLFAEILATITSLLLLIALTHLQPIIAAAETVRKRLNKSKRQLRQAQRMAKLGFWEWDIINNEFNCSDEMACMLGCRKDKTDRSFQGLLERVHQQDRIAFREKMNSALYEHAIFDIKHRLIIKDEPTRNLWHQAEVIYDQAGRPEYVYGILQDITEQTLAQQRLAETNANLRQQQIELAHSTRMATLGEMASGIAHEINQPLGAILIYANGGKNQLAKSSLSVSETGELFEQIVSQAERAAEIIKRMRSFVRKEDIHIQKIDLGALIKRVIAFIHATNHSHKLIFETECDPALPQVWADTIQIEQVITNLILNAIESMQQANSHYQVIRIHAYAQSEDFVQISISDTGPGVAEDIQDRLFDPFFTSKTKGLGLGLSICKTIIENYDGKLELLTGSSQAGATFQFTLPIKQG